MSEMKDIPPLKLYVTPMFCGDPIDGHFEEGVLYRCAFITRGPFFPRPGELTPDDLAAVDAEATAWRESVEAGTATLEDALSPTMEQSESKQLVACPEACVYRSAECYDSCPTALSMGIAITAEHNDPEQPPPPIPTELDEAERLLTEWSRDMIRDERCERCGVTLTYQLEGDDEHEPDCLAARTFEWLHDQHFRKALAARREGNR